MFKLPDKPSPKATTSELADFVEILAWVQGTASAQTVVSYLGMVDDNITHDEEMYEGCEDQEDEHQDSLDAVFEELGLRETVCGSAYPFELNGAAGTVLRLKDQIWDNPQVTAYLYLLAATRLNMQTDKTLGNVDGALEMENLSAHALKQYLGAGKCNIIVFGTSANAGNFETRVNHMMTTLSEKGKFRNIDGDEVPVQAQDDKLDVVGAIPFNDGKPGQLIIFAQAKTGTNWKSHTSELKPEVFQQKWLTHPFLVTPIRAYCIAESVQQINWNSICAEAGLLFDRCRLVECCTEDGVNTLPPNIRVWTQAAQAKIITYITA